MKKIFITGISGTGKTAVAKELKNRGFNVISIDETPNLCFWVNKKTRERVVSEVELNKEFVDAHDWVCDVEYLVKLIDTSTYPVFILGIASNQDNFIYLFDRVLLLQCDPKTFISRIENRTDNDFGKDKTVQNVILGWYEEFENMTLKKGAVSIDTDKSLNEVVQDILKKTYIVS